MVNCLVVFSIFIYEPDAIESVHFAVVANPKSPANLPTTCLSSHRNDRTRRNWNRKRIFLLWLLGERQLQFRFVFHGWTFGFALFVRA